MPTYQTKLYNFIDDSSDDIEDLYVKISGKLEVIIQPTIFKKITPQIKNQAFVEVNDVIEEGKEETEIILRRILLGAYELGIDQVNASAPYLKDTPLVAGHAAQIQALFEDANFDFGTGLDGTRKSAGQILNRIFGEQIRDKIAAGRVLGGAVPDIAKSVLEQLKDQGFVTFIRRDGKAMSLVDYSKMLTRTHLIRTASEGVISRGIQLGITIFEVSTHSGVKDDACLDIQGKLYDITGKEYPRPPSLPIHPNCRHTLQPRPDLSKMDSPVL